MRVLLDTNALIYLLDKRTPSHVQDRLKGLIQDVEKARGQLVIPTLVVSEYLVNAGPSGRALLAALMNSRFIDVAPFDHVAAEECALMHIAAVAAGNKRHPLGREVAWQKVKIDRQIVAIAKARRASIVANDVDVIAIATACGVRVSQVESLPIPAWALQLKLEGMLAPGQHTQGQTPPSRAGRKRRQAPEGVEVSNDQASPR